MYDRIIRRLETQDTFQLDREICNTFGLLRCDVLNNIQCAMYLKPHNYHAVVSSMGWAHLIPIKPEGECVEFIEGRMDGQPAMSLCLACIKARDIEDSKIMAPTVTEHYMGEARGTFTTGIQGNHADMVIMDDPVMEVPRGAWAAVNIPITEPVTATDALMVERRAAAYQAQAEAQMLDGRYNPYLDQPTAPYPTAQAYQLPEMPRAPRRTRSWPPAPRDVGGAGSPGARGDDMLFATSNYLNWANPPITRRTDENE